MPSPIRVAFVIDTIAGNTSGTERQLLGLIARLDRSRVEPHLIVLSTSDWLQSHQVACDVIVLGYSGLIKPSLAGPKRPRLWRFDSVGRTETGKIHKQKLRDASREAGRMIDLRTSVPAPGGAS